MRLDHHNDFLVFRQPPLDQRLELAQGNHLFVDDNRAVRVRLNDQDVLPLDLDVRRLLAGKNQRNPLFERKIVVTRKKISRRNAMSDIDAALISWVAFDLLLFFMSWRPRTSYLLTRRARVQ